MSKPVEIEFLMKDGVSSGLDNLDKRAVELRGTIAMLEAQLEALRLAGENASPDLDQSGNIAAIETLEKQVESLKQKLKEVEEVAETTRVVPDDLPEAGRKFNGLHNSIQQMAREMPSLAMGPQMFFMAISNNLPIFTDELKRAKEEYNDLLKAGKRGTPVWKQILGSLFSWQTALTTGIMLLVMYGDEIIDWTKDLFTAKDAVDKFTISQKEMVEIEADGRSQMVRMRFELDNVTASLKEFTGGKEEEKAKVDELNRKYGESFGYYNTVAEWYDVLIGKGEDYIETLFLQAKVQEMVNKATEADKQIAEAEAKPESDYDTWWGYGGKVDRFFSDDSHYKDNNNGQWKKREAIEELTKTRDGWLEKAQEEWDKLTEKRKDSGLGGHTKPGTDPESEYKQRVALEKRREEELLALRRKNQHDEISLLEEGKEKKLAQIRQEYADRMVEIAEQESKWKESQKGILSAEQADELDRARTNAKDRQDKELQDVERESLEAQSESMRDYLKEYGTFQQQKLAIAEEYAEKISKATTDGDRKRLAAERDSSLRGVEQKALSRKIDWQLVFGDLTGLLGDQLKETLARLESYTKSADFRDSSDTDKKTVYEAIERLRDAVPGGNGTLDLSKMRQQMEALGSSVSRYQESLLAQEQAYERLEAAQSVYRQALDTGTKAQQDAAAAGLEAAQAAAVEADAAYRSAHTDMRNLGEEYRIASGDTIDGLNQVSDGLRGFASGTLQGSFQGLQKTIDGLAKLNIGGKVGDAVGQLSETLSSAGFIGQLISAILSILDILKDGIGPIISSLVDTILGAISGIIDNILSGDLFVQVGKSLVDGVAGIFDALTWGGFSSWTDTSNAKEVEATIDRLTDRNELLQTAIEDLTEEIKSSKGTKSVAAYRQAYENQKETNANYLGIAMAQAGYHGSHHSWNYYWDGFNESQLAWIRQNVRSDFNGDLWSLTPEEMKQLRGNVDIWTSIQNTGKGGYGGRLTDKLDDYIDQAGKLEELTNQLYEGLTGISFDGMYGSFVDNLMDMKYDAKAAADDISEYFMRAMLSNKIGEMYSDKLKDWWEKFGKSMEDNELTEAERNALAEEYMGYVDEALALRDKLAEATGYDPDGGNGTTQSGKSGSFDAMTHDQGTKLEGMFTSGLQHWSSMDDRLEDVSGKMSDAESHLAKIEENTRHSAGHLGEIKEDIKTMIRDGLKMR